MRTTHLGGFGPAFLGPDTAHASGKADANRTDAEIRNHQAGSTETAAPSSRSSSARSSSTLNPRRIESKASCRTPALENAVSRLAAPDARTLRRRSLIKTP